MASNNDATGRATSPANEHDSFPNPQYPTGAEHRGPPSIISSRMTDIASDDEGTSGDAQAAGASSSPQKAPSGPSAAGDAASRPTTARTGLSGSQKPKRTPQSLQKNYVSSLAAKRGSTGAGSITNNRPPTSTSRSHVPSLQNQSFFHTLSSQKLQAQRGGSARPQTLNQQPPAPLDDMPLDSGSVIGAGHRQSIQSNPMALARLQRQMSDDGEGRPPPSRGTEFTEQETLDRITANTSPTHGHTATGSLSDSVRPLQNKPANLTLNANNPANDRPNLPSPIKSPRSFRSSFLLPGRAGDGHSTSSRVPPGAEKLSSAASSPRLNPVGTNRPADTSNFTAPNTNAGYVFQYFEGNTVFCLGGRFQNTKHRPVNIATGLMVLVPGILFFIFSAPWLWHNVSPAIPITFGYLYYICLSSFLHASASDPGILPRSLHPFPPTEDEDDPLRVGPPTNDWTLIKSYESSTAAMEVPVKHCRTCNIWRPPRAHHCRLCDNCIESHDHHCVWLNNCVGRRNYRYFFAFVTSGSLMALYLLGASLTQILLHASREGISFGASIDEFRVPFAMVIFGGIAFCYPAALMGYHIFLMSRGETTREYINSHKFIKKERFRAFTQGSIIRNWIVTLCKPRTPTYYKFKSQAQAGDQRLGERRDIKHSRKDSQGVELSEVKPAAGGFQGPRALNQDPQVNTQPSTNGNHVEGQSNGNIV